MTAEEAVDSVLSRLNTMWLPTTYLMIWPFTASEVPTAQVPWANCKIEHIDSRRLTLGDAEGKALWERVGKLIVEVCFPADKSKNDMYPLTDAILNTFEGKKTAEGVRFLNPHRSELGVVDGWLRMKVVINFKYEDYK